MAGWTIPEQVMGVAWRITELSMVHGFQPAMLDDTGGYAFFSSDSCGFHNLGVLGLGAFGPYLMLDVLTLPIGCTLW